MNIGDKIKHYRTINKMTQKQLGAETGIGEKTIQKYELGIRNPKPAQLQKIASALNISANALTGDSDFRFETVGDLIGILITLCNAKIISIKGDRGENGLLKQESISIDISPVLQSFFTVSTQQQGGLFLNDISFQIKNLPIFHDFLVWERMNDLYNTALAEQGDSPNEATQAAIADIKAKKEAVELMAQNSTVLLDISDGIKVILNP